MLKTDSMKQRLFYEPVRAWLESIGFKALVVGDKTTFVIPVSDLIPMAYKIPDIIGINKSNRVAIIEVEKNIKQFFNAFGRCLLWRCVATFVYIAYPKDKVPRAQLLNRFGIGLLEVDSESNTVKELISLPKAGLDMMRIQELHPTDYKKEIELADQIRKCLE